jgi:hypothetical protein
MPQQLYVLLQQFGILWWNLSVGSRLIQRPFDAID